jgi:hypothetical protein
VITLVSFLFAQASCFKNPKQSCVARCGGAHLECNTSTGASETGESQCGGQLQKMFQKMKVREIVLASSDG